MSNRSGSKQTRTKFITSLLLITGLSVVITAAQAQTTPNPTTSATPSAGASNATSLKVQTGSLGSYLVDSQGKSLYIFAADSPNSGASTCTDACAQVWPPLTVAQGQTAQAQAGVTSSLIGTITRSDGTQQVTYNGWPLYYYSLDRNPGDTNGQAINSFGALWYLIQADGNMLTSSQAAGTAASNATGSAAGTTAGTAAGTSAGCTYSTDAYGNMTYSGNCAGVAGTNASCTYTMDAYGNMVYSGNCAGTAPIVNGSGGFVPGHNNNHDHDNNHDHGHSGH